MPSYSPRISRVGAATFLGSAMLELKDDKLAKMNAAYDLNGPEPSHTRYGYVVPDGSIDHSVFV